MQAAIIYVTVQIFAYGLDMGTFVLLHSLYGADTVISNVAAKVVAGCFAFFSHRHITFAAEISSSLWNQAIRYGLLLLANSIASSALLTLFLSIVPNPIVAKIIADTILIAISFLLAKSVVFRSTKKADHGRRP